MNGTATEPIALLENGEVPEPIYPPALQKWFDLCAENPYLRVLVDRLGNETPPPAPMTRDQFLAFVGSLHHAPHRRILQEMLLELLADGIVELIVAMRMEDTP